MTEIVLTTGQIIRTNETPARLSYRMDGDDDFFSVTTIEDNLALVKPRYIAAMIKKEADE